MQALLEVILPVFVVIGLGYVAVWRSWLDDSAVDTLTSFAQRFAIPILLFQAIAGLDLATTFDPRLLGSFYGGAVSGFVAGIAVARLGFGRAWPDSIAIGFVGLFSNSVLLGLPITELAYGDAVLAHTFTIISIHAPFCYALGITAMEVVRADDKGPAGIARAVLTGMFSNMLILAIGLGFVVNLLGLRLPGPLIDGMTIIAAAALPTALVGLGGVLRRYRPDGDLRLVLVMCAVSLILHPAVAFGLATLWSLPADPMRAAVLTGAMAPGVNSFIFANIYGVGKRVAASSVLIATALSIGTVWVWLLILP